jgi:phage gpG-like protein
MNSGTVDYSKVEKFLDTLDDLNMTELHKSLGDTGRTIIEERFDSSKGPDGVKWKPLARTYIRYVKGGKGGNRTKYIREKSSKPLKFRHLYKSFNYDATAKQVLIGTNIDYAKYHTD